MTYLDLLRFRPPGRAADLVFGAVDSTLGDVGKRATVVSEIRSGMEQCKQFPTWSERVDVRQQYSALSTAMETARQRIAELKDDAENNPKWPMPASRYDDLTSANEQLEGGARVARTLAGSTGARAGVQAELGRVADAADATRRILAKVNDVNGWEEPPIADDALRALEPAVDGASGASRHVDELLGPWQAFDAQMSTIRSESGGALRSVDQLIVRYHFTPAMKASVDRVRDSAAAVRGAVGAVSDESRDASGVTRSVAAARGALAQARTEAAAEPTPNHFVAKCVAAWLAPLAAVGGVTGAVVGARQ
jgi:hypothetical protein